MNDYDRLLAAIEAAHGIVTRYLLDNPEADPVYLACGCFFRLRAPHRPGWRYRCWRHRLLARLRLIERGPAGGM